MKIVFISLLSHLWICNATTQTISKDVWGAGGSFFSNETVSMDWTLGETLIEYSNKSNGDISSGFQFEQRLIDLCSGNCYELVGHVHAGNELLSSGTLILIDSAAKRHNALQLTDGTFKFKQTFPGKYTFLAIPSGTKFQYFSATYFVDKRSLNTANYFQVRSTIDNLDIYLLKTETETKSNTSVQGISVYPNPAHEYINVYFDESFKVDNMCIVNALGQKFSVTTNNIKGTMQNLDVSSLNAGIYTIIIKTGIRTITKKFIKN